MTKFLFIFLLTVSACSSAFAKTTLSLSESSTVYDVVALAKMSTQVESQNLADQLLDESPTAKAVTETVTAQVDVYRGDSCAEARARYYACIANGYDFCWYRCYKKN